LFKKRPILLMKSLEVKGQRFREGNFLPKSLSGVSKTICYVPFCAIRLGQTNDGCFVCLLFSGQQVQQTKGGLRTHNFHGFPTVGYWHESS
jgi:hypothetical protein